MSSWNYRVGTRFHPYPKELAKRIGRKGDRSFFIVECHYDSKSKPQAYGEPKILDSETLKDLKWAHGKIAIALKKPVLDLDNWPETYKAKKRKK